MMMSCRNITRSIASNNRKRYYHNTMLVLAMVAAILSLLALGIALHKLRAGRALGIALRDRERQLLSLHMILQKERAHSSQMKTKIAGLKAKATSLRTQKMHLKVRLMVAEDRAAHLKHRIEHAALKGVEQTSDLPVATLRDELLKQRRDHADQVDRRLHQPGDHVEDDTNKDDSTGKGEVAADGEGDAHSTTTGGVDDQVAAGKTTAEQQQEEEREGSQPRGRLETNVDDGHEAADHDGDGRTVGEEDREQGILQVAGGHTRVIRDDGEETQGTDLRLNGTGGTSINVDGELAAIHDEVESSNTTGTVTVVTAAPSSSSSSSSEEEEEEEGKLEKNVNYNGDGEDQRQTSTTTDDTQANVRGRRSRWTRTKGQKARAAVAAKTGLQQSAEALEKSQRDSFQLHDRSSTSTTVENADGQQIFDKNAAEMSSVQAQADMAPVVQTETDAAPAEEQSGGKTVSFEASAVGSLGTTDGNSETRTCWNTEGYPGMNGSELKSDVVDNKDGLDSGEQETISGSAEGSSKAGGARQKDGGGGGNERREH